MVLSIQNDRGEEIARQVVGVGAMQPDEKRTFSVVGRDDRSDAARRRKRRH